VLLLMTATAGYFYIAARDSANRQNIEQKTAPARTDTTTSPAPTSQPGAYVGYSDTIIADTKGTKILFFHAPWCPQCRSLDNSIKEATLPDGVTIIKTDYDSNQSLRQKYGVTLQTTFVKVDDSGDLIEKYVAYNEPVYASVKANLLD
jgi:thiol-disulfide isomerase/thioredoxin